MAFQKNVIDKYDSETSLLNHLVTFRTIFIRTGYGANYCRPVKYFHLIAMYRVWSLALLSLSSFQYRHITNTISLSLERRQA